jgi:hypothetical protein
MYDERCEGVRGGPEPVYACEWSEKDLGNQVAQRQLRGNRNEGVGEHVRTRFHFGALGPVKLRGKDTRTERRKPVPSAGPVLKERTLLLEERTLPKFDPAV